MAKATRTINRDSVFRRTDSPTALPRQGIASSAATHQTAVWLSDDEVQWLDDRCQEIRRGGWRSITRSAVIRALIRAAMEHATDVGGVSGEAELTQRLSEQS